MATATVVRPSQALRTRRDAPRPALPTKRASAMDASEPAGKRRRLDEPYVRTKDYILRKFAGKPPSLTVYLHPNYFRFDGQEGSFTYDGPMVSFLKSLRNQEVPADMVEALLAGNVPFYDGCLIVEIHNHRSANGNNKGKHDSGAGDQVKFSMHNYNNYVTPSGLTPFPKKAKESELPDKSQAAEAVKSEEGGEDKAKAKDEDGPHISTLVMFPTPLSQHKEMMLLANTPASELRSKKKVADGSTTPQVSVAASQENKMALEEQDYYQFQADVLLATEPPLYLEPVKNPQEAQKVLDMLKHPLHSNPPPSPKTRKRTTAELAADDAQAAEAERRMLIMDERKATAPGAADSAGNSQALGLNRFKTLQMVREKLDEAERQKKEEQEQAQAQRKQEEAAANAAQAQKQAQQEQQRKLMNQRQHFARQQHEQMRAQQMQQAAALMAQNQSHPQQNGMANQQQNNFQHPTSMSQSSPVVRQQTPMMNSSPMVAQNGFPMAATSSQQAGSPPRPTSAAMPNPNVAMARQASQQAHASRNATPQMAQGTPNMTAMPNRQMNQTPRIPHGSPAPGTPATSNMNMASMPMPTPGQTAMTPEQFAMLQARQQQMANQVGGMNAGSPGQNQVNMTPEQIQQIQQQQHRTRQQQIMVARAQAVAQQAQQNGSNPQAQQALAQRAYLLQQQQQQQAMQQRMLQAQGNNAGQAGSPHPGSMHATPQMGHAHPQQGQGQAGDTNQGQQLTPQQQAQRQQQQQAQLRQAQHALQGLVQQYNGLQNIPQQVVSSLPPPMQMVVQRQRQQQQQTARARQMAMQAQQAQNAGQAVAGTTSTPDPEYMQTLRNHQTMLAQQQQGGQMNGMSMTHNMNFANMGNQQFQGGGDSLSQQFQAMHAALNRGQQGGGGMGQ
ncbi:hypothetical protein M409DRAFT_59462 [Zasmidium cellare ATCC 36951]|uniref:Spt20-like SEP domain-containing protein n=1 Tax=Zasmidium cellare ATCC 36951 TaxID=1080233 RepID=A0A6A6C1K5_ZASCE|nr:uncharacterized protein M409DRAFT_59462 [Zasmidium cellare ATCC 36951]KAF2160934.1 hypothetical protein M409DRAFT_59462 [Zasmidium cellare ATCC 36951]